MIQIIMAEFDKKLFMSILASWHGESDAVFLIEYGELPEWLKGSDCKLDSDAYGGSNPSLSIRTSTDSEG